METGSEIVRVLGDGGRHEVGRLQVDPHFDRQTVEFGDVCVGDVAIGAPLSLGGLPPGYGDTAQANLPRNYSGAAKSRDDCFCRFHFAKVSIFDTYRKSERIEFNYRCC